MKIIQYYSWSLKFFNGRVEFLQYGLKDNKLNKDIFETLFRGLIEIYCRVLYVYNNNEDEALRRIIWREIYLAALNDIRIKQHKPTYTVIVQDYNILKDLGENLPCIGIIRSCVQNKLRGTEKEFSDTFISEFNKTNNKFNFPSVKTCINKYLNEDDAPKMNKYWLYRIYSLISEQVHANFLMEYDNKSPEGDFIILSFTLLIFLRFLKCVSIKAHSESGINALIEEFTAFCPDLLQLWRFSRALR